MKTISARMIAALAALLLCIAALGALAWISQSKASSGLSAMFNDSVVPLRDLKIISDRYAVNIVDTTHKVSGGSMTMKEGEADIIKALAEIDKLWTAYKARLSTPKQNEFIGKTEVPLAAARRASEKALAFMKDKDLAALQEFRTNELYPAIDPGTELIGMLIDTEIEEASAIEASVKAFNETARLILAITALLALGMGTAVMAYVVRGVVNPLRGSIGSMRALADATVGEMPVGADRLRAIEDVAISGTDRQDEIGEMARTLRTFRESGIERQRLRLQAADEQTERAARSEKIEEIIAEFEGAAIAIVTTVASSSSELEASAKSMMDVARTTSEQSTLVAAASHQASQSVQALSSTGDELALSIGEIGRQAEQSSSFAAHAAEKARHTNDTVLKLNHAGQAIVEVIDLIKSIAGQTNLLALNATIEAARAGEAGRGFAVVASEVKELAAQTSRATDVIAEHVHAIRGASDDSIAAMRDITRMIEEINQVAAAIAVAVTEQSQATQGIAENVQQVAQGTAHASESIALVNEAASTTGAAAGQVLSASEELAHQSQMMRDRIDGFLRAVRAA
jgi:methyl-accepting chemotaxis protein